MKSSQTAKTKGLAVLCSLAELDDGSLRVVLDDVAKGHEPDSWVYRSLFTFKDYQTRDLADLPEKELAAFGQYVLIRLLGGERIGRTLAVDVLRLGRLRRFEITPSERPAATPAR